jgi:hypothetical protein
MSIFTENDFDVACTWQRMQFYNATDLHWCKLQT